ncbi:uncharacterized protein LOC124612698 isoform X1 [Schistocerca americana]|uniref:uncharacterized protein LOC124612698 isoform X1 n=2 Tax=Schistocerca americana TaxID=7009 RepID=UPI001F4F534F|nr:uncharacterized protein LOC124612698 isoform X1 [Schistocerca americana]
MYKDSMSTAAKQRKKKDPATHVLTKELVISVNKMKVTELNKWTPVLRSEQTPTLCFEGYVSRINGQKRRYTAYKTQPLDVRLGSYLFRQTNGETCSLVGELYDPSNNLPLSVKSKFKNGIPKKWQTIAKFWDNMQKHSFYRKQLRSFSSRFAWLESLKSSGLLRVSSRGRIIIPSPKYLKGKNVERKEVEAAHLINSQLQLISKNLDFTPVHKTDDIICTPRQPVENNCNTVNGNKSYHCTNCEDSTENPLSKSNFSHKIGERGHMQTVQNLGNCMKDTRRSSINQRKLLTCKRKLIVAEVQNKMCRSGKISKKTYEKITNKYHYRCLPHGRKYLLRSTSDARLLRKNNQCKKEPRVTSVNIRDNDRIMIHQRKQPLQTKRKQNVLNKKNNLLYCQGKKNSSNCSKQNQEGKGSKEIGSCTEYAVQNIVLEPEPCFKECRNESAVDVEKNKQCNTLLKLPYNEPCPVVRDIRSGNVLKNCANRLRKSKQRICCQDISDTERPKKKSGNPPPPKANSKVVKTLLDTSEGSGPGIDGRQCIGDAEELPSKRQEERNLGPVPAADQNLLERKGSLRKASEDISRKDRFSGKCVSSPLNNSKSSHLRLVSNERQTENRRSAVRSQLNEKQLRKVPDKSRKKSISTSKSSPAVVSPMKMAAEALEETKEAAATQGKILNNTSKRKICKNDSKQPRISDLQSSDKTEPGVTSPMKMAGEALEETKEAAATQGKMLNNTSKRKICKNDNKQPRISDLQTSDKTEPGVPSKDALETSSRKTEKSEKNKPNLSLDDIDDILTTGAPRTLKQRKKLRKTIDSYAKSQTTCTDLFADPDYNHLIGENDACSSQEWDKDYAEAIERLVNGKLSDQISLGSTSPAQYLQDFVCDDNQSVRSTSPFERTPCDEEFKLRYEHRVLKGRNECSRRKSLNMDFLSSFSQRGTDASTEADAAYNALIHGKPVPQKLFDLKSNENNTSSDDSSSECSDEI